MAKEKYGKNYPSAETKDWATETYESRGGSWDPKLLENYDNNRRHDLLEGYDKKVEIILKDEYQTGKRVRHKTYDP